MFRFIFKDPTGMTGRYDLAEVRQILIIEPLNAHYGEFLIYDGSN